MKQKPDRLDILLTGLAFLRPLVKVGAGLIALKELPVALVATAPKDVFNQKATIEWLQTTGIAVLGCGRALFTMFLICSFCKPK